MCTVSDFRLGRESINYLQATGNSAQAKCQVNARDEFVDLRNRKFLKFIDSLQLDEDTTDSTELLSSFSLKTDSDEVVEIILAESLKVCICVEICFNKYQLAFHTCM